MRFRLAELITVTACFCFLTAALVRADAVFESLFASFAFGLTLIALLLAIANRGSRRAFWTGFVVASGFA